MMEKDPSVKQIRRQAKQLTFNNNVFKFSIKLSLSLHQLRMLPPALAFHTMRAGNNKFSVGSVPVPVPVERVIWLTTKDMEIHQIISKRKDDKKWPIRSNPLETGRIQHNFGYI